MYKSKFGGPSNPLRSAIGVRGLLPRPRSEELAVWNSLHRCVVEVCCVKVNSVTPPVQLLTTTGVDNSEEDDDARNSDAKVESE